MDTRLFAFAESHQLDVPGQQELLRLVEELVQESLAAGRSVLDWGEEDIASSDEPLFASDATGDAGQRPSIHPNPTADIDAWKVTGAESPPSMSAEQRYEVLGLIGVGSMGEVHRAKDKQLKRVVAMKVMREELNEDVSLVARFIEEAQATAQLEHPGIIPLHDLGRMADGRYYFTMKEIKGRGLDSVILELHENSRYHGEWTETYDGWTMRRLIDSLRTVAEALGYAHSRGVVHRDLKPENVMLGAFGEVLVLDWGLVKVVGGVDDGIVENVETYRSDDERFATLSGAVIGTPMYMSPEQALGTEEIDVRADVYSLGALLYETLAGRPPYQGDSYVEVLDKLLNTPPPPLHMSQEEIQQKQMMNPYFRPPLPVPDALANICFTAMSRERESRYADGVQFALALEQWLSS